METAFFGGNIGRKERFVVEGEGEGGGC